MGVVIKAHAHCRLAWQLAAVVVLLVALPVGSIVLLVTLVLPAAVLVRLLRASCSVFGPLHRQYSRGSDLLRLIRLLGANAVKVDVRLTQRM